MELSSKQRAQLRGMANGLEVILTIGKEEIGENLIKQANDALEARELIKCNVLESSQLSPKEACAMLARVTRSEPVQVIGNKFVLYRHSHKLGEKCINLVQPKQKKTSGKKYEAR